MGNLIKNSMLPFMIKDKMTWGLNFLYRFSNMLPINIFSFRPDASAYYVLMNELAKNAKNAME